jgi:hypothetical protein
LLGALAVLAHEPADGADRWCWALVRACTAAAIWASVGVGCIALVLLKALRIAIDNWLAAVVADTDNLASWARWCCWAVSQLLDALAAWAAQEASLSAGGVDDGDVCAGSQVDSAHGVAGAHNQAWCAAQRCRAVSGAGTALASGC